MSKANRLIEQTSPYLLQHAYNPVHWYPWGEEAFREAREKDRPVLLSIGYSSCHWCHVMERESFEDEETAEMMNRLFVSIKVDREERPDIDSIYMDYVQMITGSGGWPLTVFLTPDQLPFYGGTYFPPEPAYGRPSFRQVLEAVSGAYHDRRDEIDEHAASIRAHLGQAAAIPGSDRAPDESVLDSAFQALARQFDSRHGGFGGAPKFPPSMTLEFLLRYWSRHKSERALEMVELTLDEMARGGLYDQLGGGFHRYSVDDRWLVPHFEKMLYDNALLTRVYLHAYQATGKAFYRDVVRETIGYVLREMQDEAGGFYSALDADSEGEEGKFYVWTRDEIYRVLGDNDGQLFADYYDVSSTGNFEGKNILHHRVELGGVANRLGQSEEELRRRLDAGRAKLLRVREERVRPGLDDKILCSWNGLMLAAIAEAAFVLGDSKLLAEARRNAEFLLNEMVREGRVHRTWKAGNANLNGYLEDYAFLVDGLITLYEASGEPRWLKAARNLTDCQIELFHDPESGLFYFTSTDHEKLLVRQKEYIDNAIPSGNSVTCSNLLRLSELFAEPEYKRMAAAMLGVISPVMSQHPTAVGQWLQSADLFIGPMTEIAVTGNGAERDILLNVVRDRYVPSKVIAWQGTDQVDDETLPLLEGRGLVGGRPAAYVCRNFTCLAPVTTAEDLAAELERVEVSK